KGVGRKTRTAQKRGQRTGSGNYFHWHAAAMRFTHKSISWIRNTWRPRIRHERGALAIYKTLHQRVDLRVIAVVVVRDQLCIDAEMAEQPQGVTGVLCVAKVYFREDSLRAWT